jgi:branched-subunit amino acid transport protein
LEVQVTLLDLALIVGMALAVYAPKALPLVLISERHAEPLKRWLTYVAPAVLGALVAPGILLRPPGWHLAAFGAAAVVAGLTRRMILALAIGAVGLVVAAILR